jgi:hypothetical protein
LFLLVKPATDFLVSGAPLFQVDAGPHRLPHLRVRNPYRNTAIGILEIGGR